jgi:TRAP-type C4-dicarboxylate transport system permease small subunit
MKRLISRIDAALVLLGGIFLVGMVLLTTGNIISRLIWVPIPGTFELMGFFGAVVASFALGYTQRQKGHIAVDILIGAFPRRVKKALECFNSLVCLLFFCLIAWQVAEKARTLQTTGEVTETLRIAYHPFTYGVAVGCGFLALVFLWDLITALRPETREKP